ncbi:hypothetical protein ACWOFR_00775 [Carnobacterium gallinarum]|nr:hypothetical protein [Carnobacterium gallinarum]
MKDFVKINSSLDLLKVTVTCVIAVIVIFLVAQYIGEILLFSNELSI